MPLMYRSNKVSYFKNLFSNIHNDEKETLYETHVRDLENEYCEYLEIFEDEFKTCKVKCYYKNIIITCFISKIPKPYILPKIVS